MGWAAGSPPTRSLCTGKGTSRALPVPVARQLAHPQPSLSSENVSIPWSPCPEWGYWRQGQERVLFTSYPRERQLLLAED